jgi:hypothetical protein
MNMTVREAMQRLSLYAIAMRPAGNGNYTVALQDRPNVKPRVAPSLEDAVLIGMRMRREHGGLRLV